MKKKLVIILMTVVIIGGGIQTFAANNVDRLISKMTNEREEVLLQVVEGWKSNEDPEKLRKLVLQLVDVHVRLVAVERSADQDFAGRVIGSVQVNPEKQDAKALAGAVAQAYYAQKGLRVNTRDRFQDVYHVWTVRR